jgi:hypothetical protein
MCPKLKIVTEPENPHKNTVAVLDWLLGDLRGDRDFALMIVLTNLICLLAMSAVVVFLPSWLSLLLVILCASGLLWAMHVLVTYGWESPWRR